MKDIITFETAVRLKEAGFPQPAPEVGQVWYNNDFGPFFVGKLWMADRRLRNIFYPNTGKVVNKEIRLFPDFVFAPTATDIIRMIPDYELLSFATQDRVLFIDTITDVQTLAAMWLGQHSQI